MEAKRSRPTNSKTSKVTAPPALMSDKTREFVQKICYKKPAAVDMTKYGFERDRSTFPVQLLLKPLRDQLQTMWGKQESKAHRPRAGSAKTRKTRTK